MEVVLPKPGKYVIAVSGGVDSASLLHVLRASPKLELAVAHFDHGIRLDAGADRQFVEALAKTYKLPFYYAEGKLGPGASEATARQARYAFLRKIQDETGARAVVTAHHQDDVLETAIINMLRGTGRKGLSSLTSRQGIDRPLLGVTKNEILAYARENDLRWREDSTNADTAYLRNYVRQRILPRFTATQRQQLLRLVSSTAQINSKIDTLLVKYLSGSDERIDRGQFGELPHGVAMEVMAAWLRGHELRDFDSRTLERLVVGGKNARPGSQFDVRRSVKLRVSQDNLALVGVER